MKRDICIVLMGIWILGAASIAEAVPVISLFVDDSRGDVVPSLYQAHEIGDKAVFPLASAIDYHAHRAPYVVGVPDDGVANDWIMHIKNVSGQAWGDVHFVADLGVTVGNSDGRLADIVGAAGVYQDAFRIDSTGANSNLVSESLSVNGILDIGEEWEFIVTNFNTGVNSLVPTLNSPGVFAGSSPMGGVGATSASLIASPVPEPGVAGVVGLLVGALLLRRPGRKYVPYL